MPPILSTQLEAVREVAASWRENHPGESPDKIPREVRLRSSQARAAFFVAQLGLGDLHPLQGSCSCCGTLTSSWCEGCYARCGSGHQAYSSVCQHCDRLQLVCQLCLEANLTYQIGHEAFRSQQQQGCTDHVEVTVEEGG